MRRARGRHDLSKIIKKRTQTKKNTDKPWILADKYSITKN